MKREVNHFFYICVAVILLAGCKDDSCTGVVCVNGSCANGTCICEAGYEGTDCSIKSVVKFVGTWFATDQCDPDTHQYTATIAASSTTTNLLIITNFGGLGTSTTALATINGLHITLETQDVGNFYTVSGTGSLDQTGTQIEFNYTVIDSSGNTTECSSIWNL